MNLNFILTGKEFPYQYYLAVKSGMNVHTYDKAILWVLDQISSPYMDKLKKDGLVITKVTLDKNASSLSHMTEKCRNAMLKDVLLWRLAYTDGGIFLDMDTVSISDISGMLEDRDLVAPMDIANELDCAYPFNNAIIISKAGSLITKTLYEQSQDIISSSESIAWGSTGPILLSKVVPEFRDRVVIPEFRVLGGFGGHEREQIYSEEVKLDPKIKVIHAFAIASGNKFDSITPSFINKSNSPYAIATRAVIAEKDRNVFNVADWLQQRGNHYKPMFDWLSSHRVYNILEIGTFNGDNAIGMINTTPTPNENIVYYGFDLFESHTKEQEICEVSTGYNNPPDILEVSAKIINATGASVQLFKGDSKLRIPQTDLPIMDFIYIDGGHSKETVIKDWLNVIEYIGPNTVVFFDDYFIGESEIGAICAVPFINTNKFNVQLVGSVDAYEKYSIQLMKVTPRISIAKCGTDKLRVHLLGIAHVPSNEEVSLCAYTQKAVKLSKMLTDLGHEVIFYGGEESDVKCSEFVQCISKQDRIDCYGDYDWRTHFFKHDPKDAVYTKFNENASKEINKRKEAKDLLLITFGNYYKPISDETNVLSIESGIGYSGVYTNFKVFESYAWMHYVYGLIHQQDGANYDCVIPNYFYPQDFPYGSTQENFYLFIGRLIRRKGIEIAVEATKRIGASLIVAGQGSLISVEEGLNIQDKHVTHIGSVDAKKRSELMGKAKAVFVPTMYIEPFGGVAVEAMMCGAPVISSDYGAFTETVQHGKTGFRCHTLEDYIWSAENVHRIDRNYCHDYAIANYSADRIALMYDEYFHKVLDLYDEGWYTIHLGRKQLNWLNKKY